MILLLLSFQNESDRDTFSYIFDTYRNLMLHKAYGVLHDYMLAEDAVSEAFLRIYRNIHKIEDPDSPRAVAFIITIVKNAAITMLRKAKREQTEWEGYDTIADAKNLEEQVVSSLSTAEIYALVNTLPEDTRAAFVLKYAYDLSHKQIGNLLGATENTVTVKLHRAKKKLATALQERGCGT